ncbi:hypothetical protein D1155_14370 [Anaerotruncus sp. 80]|uniref:Sulfatase-modifying factor enzyme-like domain-containing protein n=1 Tax=Anaerotruncus colihominis TaxID=169435 RepID=A0A845QL59_9FIRM|nr:MULTISPECIES: SUMF1/EgtB/PvdO family nonheme iron enzyme [Anaerotruncus]NBH62830.1 hypothetical protein [Anaerotruncus colihominis]NCF03484.1 hypothetical protein [Anaerotruncus sp. 80]
MKQLNLTGNNVVLYDDLNQESVMVRIPKFRLSDVIDGAPDLVHPAFIVDGEEKECIYISKYQNVVRSERACSLPGEDPAVLYSIEEAERFCRNKGKGWHLMTSAEWAAIALWCLKNETLPRGNNDGGKAWDKPHEHGTVVSLHGVVPEGEKGPPMRVGCGSGPASWSHDGTLAGIFDLNGNIWEMTAGLRLHDGVLECVADNDAARYTLESAPWSQICADDLTLKESGDRALSMTEGAKEEGVRFTAAEMRKKDANQEILAPFSELTWETDLCESGNLLQQLCLIPSGDAGHHTDAGWAVTEGVRYPIRGGYWVNREMAGILAYGFYMQAEDRYFDVGFRCCYIEESEESS